VGALRTPPGPRGVLDHSNGGGEPHTKIVHLAQYLLRMVLKPAWLRLGPAGVCARRRSLYGEPVTGFEALTPLRDSLPRPRHEDVLYREERASGRLPIAAGDWRWRRVVANRPFWPAEGESLLSLDFLSPPRPRNPARYLNRGATAAGIHRGFPAGLGRGSPPKPCAGGAAGNPSTEGPRRREAW
jgi:hypothetical protein